MYDPNMVDRWYINDRGKRRGPLTWGDVSFIISEGQVSSGAMIKNELWPNEVPITNYFHPQYFKNVETMGLIPGKYDALFYAGIGVGIVAIFGLMINFILGLLLLALSLFLEIFAIKGERESKPFSTMSSIGNICAVGWIIVQILAFIFIGSMIM
jgi:hypothetical protein